MGNDKIMVNDVKNFIMIFKLFEIIEENIFDILLIIWVYVFVIVIVCLFLIIIFLSKL